MSSGAVTLNVAVAVTSSSQSLLAVQVTVIVLPHSSTEPSVSVLTCVLQPPLTIPMANQSVYMVSIAS